MKRFLCTVLLITIIILNVTENVEAAGLEAAKAFELSDIIYEQDNSETILEDYTYDVNPSPDVTDDEMQGSPELPIMEEEKIGDNLLDESAEEIDVEFTEDPENASEEEESVLIEETMQRQLAAGAFEKGAFIVSASSGSDIGYTSDANGGVLTIKKNGAYEISMKNGIKTTTDRIKVDAGVSATITIDNVKIDLSDRSYMPETTPGVMDNTGKGRPFDMKGATVTLRLKNTNSFRATDGRTALFCPSGSTLVIEGPGSLTAETGAFYCVAAIGGEGVLDSDYQRQYSYGEITYKNNLIAFEEFVWQLQGYREWDAAGVDATCGSVTIKSGTVNANAYVGHHEIIDDGIWDPYDAGYEAMIIRDGGGSPIVTAGNTAVAIGGANGGPIRIEGGTVNAKSTTRSTTIGSTTNEFSGGIYITGGKVDAQNGYRVFGSIAMTDTGTDAVYGPAIGWASYSLVGDSSTVIEISGTANVTAKGTYGCAGIGGGRNGSGGHITIGGNAIVNATGGLKAAGIGGGIAHNPNKVNTLTGVAATMGTGTIIIKDNAKVTAKGGDDAAGIGGGGVRNNVTTTDPRNYYYPSEGQAGTIIIEGAAEVIATGGKNGAGIGSGGSDTGNDCYNSCQIQNLIITTTGVIKATGGTNAANIGIGYLSNGTGTYGNVSNNNNGTRVTGVYVNTTDYQSNFPGMKDVPNSITKDENGNLVVSGTVDFTKTTITNPVVTASKQNPTPTPKQDIENKLLPNAKDVSEAIKDYLDNNAGTQIVSDPTASNGTMPSLTIDNSVSIPKEKVQGVSLNGDSEEDSEPAEVLPEDMPEDGQVPDGLWLDGVKSVTYDGTKKTQQFRVYDGTERLTENIDYTVKYKNNINAYTLTEEEEGFSYAKAPTITVTGKGDYSGTIVKTFVIQPIDLSTYSDVAVTGVFVGEDSKGKVQKLKPVVTVMIDGKSVTLKDGKDIQYNYPSEDEEVMNQETGEKQVITKAYASPGVYDITITGIGNYTGTIEPNVKETIIDTTATKLLSKMSITTGTATLSDADYVVGEKAIPAADTVVVKDTKLTSGQQVLTGKYCDSKEEATVAINDQSIIDAGIHYVYYCTNNTVPGKGKIIFMGVKANGYEGTVIKTYKVSGYTLKGFVVEGVDAVYPFTGKEIEPAGKAGEVTLPVDLPFKVCKKGKNGDILSQLVKGVNYKVNYINHVNAGTATIVITGINNYSGVLKKTFKITAKAGTEEKGSMVVEDISSQIYVKTGVKPAVVVKDADTGEALELGKDYTLTYSNNKKIHSGKAEDDTKKNPVPKVVVKGIKNYSGTVTKIFGIQNSSLSNANISMLVSDVVYKDAPGQCKPAITLYDIDGSKLNVGNDYETAIKYTYETFTDAEGNPTDSIKSISIKTKNGKVSGTATRNVGDEVKPEDIVPVNTVIKAEVTGKGFYSGTGEEDSTVSKTFRYTAKSISKMKVTVVTQTYTGEQLKPDFSNGDVKVYDGPIFLEGGTDYTIEYNPRNKNINKGIGKLTIKGKGTYGGYKEVSFKITQKTMGYTIAYDNNLEQAKEKFGENVNISGTMKNGTISTGTKLAKCNYKLTDLNRKTYTFVGWCTKPNPVDEKDGHWYSDQETFRMKGLIQMLFGKKQTLYAQWKE